MEQVDSISKSNVFFQKINSGSKAKNGKLDMKQLYIKTE